MNSQASRADTPPEYNSRQGERFGSIPWPQRVKFKFLCVSYM
jgi:hypothetical protein